MSFLNHKANDVGERVLSRLHGYVSKADSIWSPSCKSQVGEGMAIVDSKGCIRRS